MLTKARSQLWFTCDECGDDTSPHDDDEFDQALADAKGDGWDIRKVRGQWEHRCPSCNVDNDRLAAAKRLFGR